MDRREFVKQAGALTALAAAGLTLAPGCINAQPMRKKITITKVDANFDRQKLRRPFGFKGGFLTNNWQTAAYMETDEGIHKVGPGIQSVLWCDATTFLAHSENGGNALMFAMTERALQMLKGQSFTDPMTLLDELLPEVLAYGKTITRNPDLRTTFALNALVAVDNAAWLHYAEANQMKNFDEMVPEAFRPGLSFRHKKVAAIPALSYGTPMEEIKQMADQGFFIMKIKIGAPGTQEEMLEKDKEFLTAIHQTIGHYETTHTKDGKLPYYFDANGRYDSKDTLHKFLDHAEKIGALAQIAVVEEPFGERNQESVHDLAARGPRIAADESAHTVVESIARIEQGYNSIAVKAIAKTMSMTIKIAQACFERNIPCFCADLTVNPWLVDWNKVIAARLAPFPDMDFGLQETNGWQNYQNWEEMRTWHPMADAPWTRPVDGVYETGAEFFEKSGGIFMPSTHFEAMFQR